MLNMYDLESCVQECDIFIIHIFRPYIYKLEDNDVEVCNLW